MTSKSINFSNNIILFILIITFSIILYFILHLVTDWLIDHKWIFVVSNEIVLNQYETYYYVEVYVKKKYVCKKEFEMNSCVLEKLTTHL